MCHLVEESRHLGSEPIADVVTVPKLMKLTEQYGIEAYITVFERMMSAYGVDRSRWSYELARQLTGKVQRAFTAMEADQSGNYDTVSICEQPQRREKELTVRRRRESWNCMAQKCWKW